MSRTARALLFLVRVYQSFFSGLTPSACKFYPSCSHYAADALRLHGARRGSWLVLRRVLRCHPFTRGGVDLVPDADESSMRSPGLENRDSERALGMTEGQGVRGSLLGFEGTTRRSGSPQAYLPDRRAKARATQAEACATREVRP
jgi:uncharacterized protein